MVADIKAPSQLSNKESLGARTVVTNIQTTGSNIHALRKGSYIQPVVVL